MQIGLGAAHSHACSKVRGSWYLLRPMAGALRTYVPVLVLMYSVPIRMLIRRDFLSTQPAEKPKAKDLGQYSVLCASI